MQVAIVFNGLLVGASGYAMYCISPQEYPYAFTACAYGFCHGLLGLWNVITADESEEAECAKSAQISSGIMEIIPLPLTNIDLYLHSSQSSSLALGHGLFIIPLAFDLVMKLFFDENDDSATETLKDLTIMGNVVSTTFIAVNESNALYGAIAATAFLTKYGSRVLDYFFEGTESNATLFGHAVLCILVAQAVGSSAE